MVPHCCPNMAEMCVYSYNSLSLVLSNNKCVGGDMRSVFMFIASVGGGGGVGGGWGGGVVK